MGAGMGERPEQEQFEKCPRSPKGELLSRGDKRMRRGNMIKGDAFEKCL